MARFIRDEQIPHGRVILHTENRAGCAAMAAILETCEVIPYGKLKKMNFHSLLKASIEPRET